MNRAGGSYRYPMLTVAVEEFVEAAKAKDSEAGTAALNELEALCQAADRGRNISMSRVD